MGKRIPTLSTAGWIESVAEKADKALSYFFVSEYSQSLFHRGNITSLPHLIQQFGDDPLTLKGEMESRLSDYLRRIFDEVQCVAEVRSDDNNPSRTVVILYVVIREDGKEYSLGKEVRTLNSTIESIMDLNNEGKS